MYPLLRVRGDGFESFCVIAPVDTMVCLVWTSGCNSYLASQIVVREISLTTPGPLFRKIESALRARRVGKLQVGFPIMEWRT